MLLSDFDYPLDDRYIATRPVSPRHAAKLLVSKAGELSDHVFLDLADQLSPGDLLILNDTKVIPGRLTGLRRRDTPHGSGEATVELTLIERLSEASWRVLAKPAKRLAPGDIIEVGAHRLHVLERDGADTVIEAATEGALSLDTLSDIGSMPLPPYIAKKRAADERDRDDYQTMFAKNHGAVAAPTASLHFTPEVFERLANSGVRHSFVTLHVGAGTFLPVTADDVSDHRMHSEWYDLPAKTAAQIEAAWQSGGRVIPVGTTAMRTLESAATRPKSIAASSGDTDIFIKPGYHFKASDGLVTNFHLPKSTLLMLVAALVGMDQMREIYSHALQADYRFFSYGDSSLLIP